jgi:hypothetical protein
MTAEQLTPEQEHLREETIKWLQKFNNQTPFCGINFYTNAADSLLTIQQAAGAVLRDSDQTMEFARVDIKDKPEVGRFYDGYKAAQVDLAEARFVKVQPLTGGYTK